MNFRKAVIFLSLPLAALAVAVLMLSWNSSAQKASAVGTLDTSISSASGCSSAPAGPAKCNIPIGGTMTIDFNISGLPATTKDYSGYDFELTYNAAGPVNYVAGSLVQQGAGVWPSCGVPVGEGPFVDGQLKTACTLGVSAANSTYIGVLMHLQMSCTEPAGGSDTLTLVAGNGNTDVLDGNGTPQFEAASEVLLVNCVPATNTPTPLPTATPPPQPRVQKDCDAATAGVQTQCNVFLVRHGAKIPPPTCLQGNNIATLTEGINIPITSQDPKGLTGFQQLGAAAFEVRFDEKAVCVEIVPNATLWGANGVCTVQDSTNSTLQGIARFGCVTIGKDNNLNALLPGEPFATILVRPTEETINQLRPNQDNGIPVQIMNQDCKLADEQGHPIAIFSCEDADITFRFLEGDVDGPDCTVGVLDAQNEAFRWGAQKGSLLYQAFLDLSPSGQVKGDGRIDISDLQFVFGRLTSTCTAPWPAQLPVNPKA